MIDLQLAETSDTLFWVTLIAYAIAAVLLLHHLAFKGARTATVGTSVAWVGVVIHLGSIVTRGMAASRVPWGNMYEYSSVLAFLLVLMQLAYVDLRKGLRSLSGITLTVAILWLGVARATTYVPAQELQVSLNSIWLKIHVFAAITGSTMFALSAIYSTLYLIKARADRRIAGSTVGAAHIDVFDQLAADTAPPSPRAGFTAKLPAADRLDELAHRTVQFAFPVWTFAVMAGAIWAHVAWGRYWGWDPKETWALITWVVYAGYLHARATAGWKDRRAAVLNIAAFGVVLFTYYGVNLFISGLHSYKNG